MSRKKQTDLAAKQPEQDAAEKETDLRRALFNDTYAELVKKQISNAENLDRSVLTLSASALGLSLTFIKDIVKLPQAHTLWALVFSWCLFGVSVVSTIISLLSSQEAIRLQILAAEKYYIHRDELALKESLASKLTTRLNLTSGFAFVTGIVLTVIFITTNLPA